MLLSRKRPHSPDASDEHSCERNKCYPTFVLESESPLPTDEDCESYYSVQLAGTVSPKDTSDTSWSSDSLTMDVEMDEYDVASITHSDEKLMSNCDSSGTDEMICTAAVTTVLMASDLCEDQALWADSSDVGSDSTTDSEVPKADYWDCVRCKSKCSPLNPYCLKCFQLRKGYFPERPKRRHPRRRRRKASGPGKGLADSAANGADTERVLTPASESPEELSGTLEKEDSGIHMGPAKRQCTPESPLDLGGPPSQDLLGSQSSTPPLDEADRDKDMPSQRSELCFMCVERPRNGGFIHKTAVHILCCYQCSLRTWNRTRKCPMCNKRPQNVAKLIYG